MNTLELIHLQKKCQYITFLDLNYMIWTRSYMVCGWQESVYIVEENLKVIKVNFVHTNVPKKSPRF